MKNIILDFDSTIVTVEGIDELARIKGVYDNVKELTNLAMNGDLPLEKVFAARLDLIQPTADEVSQIAQLYLNSITPMVEDFIRMARRNHNVFVVSGGYRQAILPTIQSFGLTDKALYANTLLFDEKGKYTNFDQHISLWHQTGKRQIIEIIKSIYPCSTLLIGDGMSDALAKTDTTLFVQFSGVVHRPEVSLLADYIMTSFNDPMLEILLE